MRNQPPASRRPPRRLVLALLGGLPAAVAGQSQQRLGTVDFPIECSAPARREFNRAVALLHHMTYPQAREGFERVAAADPGCAMAHWGVAMTLFQPLWPTRPSLADRQRGLAAARRGLAIARSERERRFLTAAEGFFLEPESPDYWLRIRRWRDATEALHVAFPDDIEAGAFHALALLATAPTDTETRAAADRAAGILLAVHRRNPDHPGASHYLVHANDVTGREGESPEITRRYAAVAPRNPHALHMPTHIYVRTGDWPDVIDGNLRAAEAALEIPAGDRGQYVWDEFPHAIEYLVYAQLQRGADDAAAAVIARLARTERLEPTFKTAFHLASTKARYALERHDWAEAARLEPRSPATLDWSRFAWPEAIGEFARGLGGAHLGDTARARTAVHRLGELETAMRTAGETLFARNIEMLRLELRSWMAHGAGRIDSSRALMGAAADLEATTPKHAVTPGPTIPALELLGDLLMEQGDHRAALAAYQRSLELYPRRLNGLLGTARAARALGDTALARSRYRELVAAADSGSRRPGVAEAKAYLASRP